MPTTINLQGRLGAIRVPPGWQKPCKAGQWRDGVLAASTSVGLGSSYFPFDDVPAGLAPDGNGGIFVLTTCNWEPGQGPFALRRISAIGKSALRVEFGNPTFWAANRGLWSEGTLVPSGSGRCIVVWAKDFDHFTIMAQCYDQNGQPLWNNGNPINASGGFNWAWRMPLNLLAEPDGRRILRLNQTGAGRKTSIGPGQRRNQGLGLASS